MKGQQEQEVSVWWGYLLTAAFIGAIVLTAQESPSTDQSKDNKSDQEHPNSVVVEEKSQPNNFNQSQDIRKMQHKDSIDKEVSNNDVLTTQKDDQGNTVEKLVAQPHYKIYKENVEDTPGKTSVERILILEKPIQDKEAIKAILLHHYREMINSTGYKYHKNPTLVVAYLYETKEHYFAGMGQWVAQVIQTPSETVPEYNFMDRFFEKKQTEFKSDIKLMEVQRRNIWKELIQAEWNAEKEAFEKYPYTVDHPRYQHGNDEKNTAYFDKRMVVLQNSVRKKYNLTPEMEAAIREEAFQKNWPLPPQPSYDY